MKARCKNAKVPSHGAQHIRYDPRWESFENFLVDMGPRPDRKTLDRINVMGDYHKANCRWASDITQANNKRDTEILYYNFEGNGAGASCAEWARHLRNVTGNSLWSVRHLISVMKTLTLDQIIGAIHPQRLKPEELSEKEREACKSEEAKRMDEIFSQMIFA